MGIPIRNTIKPPFTLILCWADLWRVFFWPRSTTSTSYGHKMLRLCAGNFLENDGFLWRNVLLFALSLYFSKWFLRAEKKSKCHLGKFPLLSTTFWMTSPIRNKLNTVVQKLKKSWIKITFKSYLFEKKGFLVFDPCIQNEVDYKLQIFQWMFWYDFTIVENDYVAKREDDVVVGLV